MRLYSPGLAYFWGASLLIRICPPFFPAPGIPAFGSKALIR